MCVELHESSLVLLLHRLQIKNIILFLKTPLLKQLNIKKTLFYPCMNPLFLNYFITLYIKGKSKECRKLTENCENW